MGARYILVVQITQRLARDAALKSLIRFSECLHLTGLTKERQSVFLQATVVPADAYRELMKLSWTDFRSGMTDKRYQQTHTQRYLPLLANATLGAWRRIQCQQTQLHRDCFRRRLETLLSDECAR